MNQNDRVLGRKGARDLTPGEVERVIGAIRIGTQTVCTVLFNLASNGFDGDPGECGF